ncbi:hypothetical protein BC777_2107 [Yoonia maricola]|uniref:Dolichyl-phosphate-mannose-protein mannosyltransferase n=1 Tax=Yoonia maricola TaxID=420999 RepID=A0A2M8W4A9_9RHOB|nr:hypothetical protein [Yoonia maricola]PJI85761.1 hypothetical protein BC777_2107 [Yoonia maricola]
MIKNRSLLCAYLCAFFGAVIYALLAFGIILPQPYGVFGTDIYDAYFYRLLEGRFDLPLRMLTFEGHYASDGTGMLYHGVAPLLTRAVLYPFVTLHTFPTAALSIWLWSATGAAIYHAITYKVISKYAGPISLGWSIFIAIAVWIAAPGLFLSSTIVLYHEPFSIAFAATAGTVYILICVALFDMPMRRALIPLALLAALLLHTRPHVAVGAYAGIVVLIGLALRYDARRAVLPVAASLVLLGAIGLSFLELNKARFGSATQFHGQIDEENPEDVIEYGPVFFGTDYIVTGRGVVFKEHGRFHPWRIIPNGLLYALDTPFFYDEIDTLHTKATIAVSGQGHIEFPRFGMIHVWPVWLFAALIGMGLSRPRITGGMRALPVLAVTTIAALFILSYPTVTLRYRFEVWPLLVTLALLSFPGCVNRFGTGFLKSQRVIGLSYVVLVTSLIFAMAVSYILVRSYRAIPGAVYEPWSMEFCAERIAHKAFSPDDIDRLCTSPDSVFQEWEDRRDTPDA